MGLQKYRADIQGEPDANGAISWYARWMGGPLLSKIERCPIAHSKISARTVYITGHPDTFFSQPAACRVKGKTIRGWVGCEDNRWLFHPNSEHHDWLTNNPT